MSEMVERVMLALSNSGLDDVIEEDAIAAIEAMREPTEAMRAVAGDDNIVTDYSAMIDAALKD